MWQGGKEEGKEGGKRIIHVTNTTCVPTCHSSNRTLIHQPKTRTPVPCPRISGKTNGCSAQTGQDTCSGVPSSDSHLGVAARNTGCRYTGQLGSLSEPHGTLGRRRQSVDGGALGSQGQATHAQLARMGEKEAEIVSIILNRLHLENLGEVTTITIANH